MKRIFFALTLVALVLPAVPRTNGAEVSVDFFYNNISGGSWVDVEDYGYGWQPDAAVSDADWRPYADGYWAYTDYGWTWVSYEDFGWATYHYGRWAKIEDMGWVWFPGSDLEWGPAWVSWRTGGDQIGWAPLPPRGAGIVYEGRPIGGRVDVEFDIGPAYYNFVDVRFIGEPVLRSHIYAPSYNVTYINQTVNVTNITVKNKIVYNYGPDVTVLSQHSARPIQRLKIDRQTNVDVSVAAKSGGLTKVQGDKLVISAPQTIHRAGKEIAPPTVKTKVAKTKIERGWKGVGDANTETQLKQKMKTEDLKKIPLPTGGAAAASAGGVPPTGPGSTIAPAAGGTASPPEPTGASKFERGKHRGPGEKGQPGKVGAPGTSPGGSPLDESMTSERGKHKGKQGQSLTNPESGTGTATEGAGATPFEGKLKGKRGKPMPSESMAPGGATTGETETIPPTGKQKARRLESGQVPPGGVGPGEGGPPSGGKQKGKRFEPGQVTPGDTSAAEGGPQHEGKMGKQKARRLEPGEVPAGGAGSAEGGPGSEGRVGKKGQQTFAPQQGGAPGQPGAGQPERGKKKKGGEKESPPPAPTP